MITDAMLPAFQGVVPSHVTTCSADGAPNVTAISQVHYVDATHVALSNQFFSKTRRNLDENPYAFVQLIHPDTGAMWFLELRFLRSEAQGPLFEAMEMQLDAIASLQGMQGVFKLQSADVYEVVSVREAVEASLP
jgi:predicted pyridoxine 5'-phosphate oxidase superfamily flavin-nucleotide-binding protein